MQHAIELDNRVQETTITEVEAVIRIICVQKSVSEDMQHPDRIVREAPYLVLSSVYAKHSRADQHPQRPTPSTSIHSERKLHIQPAVAQMGKQTQTKSVLFRSRDI